MKKRTTRMTALALTAAALLSMTACGGKDESTSGGLLGGSAVSNDLTMRDYISQGETVWLKLADDGYQGKDSEVTRIFVLESNGDLYTAPADDMTLGDAAQMEDAEIAEMVKAEYEAGFENDYNGDLARIKWDYLGATKLVANVMQCVGVTDQMDELVMESKGVPQAMKQPVIDLLNQMLEMAEGSSEGWDVIMLMAEGELIYQDEAVLEEQIMNYFGGSEEHTKLAREIFAEAQTTAQEIQDILDQMEPQPGAYKLAIQTDATGNETQSMLFAYQTASLSREDMKSLELYYMTPAGGASTNCGNEVYDATYGGFNTDDGMLLTRIDSKYNFVLEEAADSDLPRDVEAEELFA